MLRSSETRSKIFGTGGTCRGADPAPTCSLSTVRASSSDVADGKQVNPAGVSGVLLLSDALIFGAAPSAIVRGTGIEPHQQVFQITQRAAAQWSDQGHSNREREAISALEASSPEIDCKKRKTRSVFVIVLLHVGAKVFDPAIWCDHFHSF